MPAEAPVLSVVVAIVSDTTDAANAWRLADCLDALMHQKEAPLFEIIVPHHAWVTGIDALQARFPQVVFLRIDDLRHVPGQGGSREHHDELRARGLAVARGQLLGLLEDHGRPDPYWCRRVVDAHRAEYAGVGGAIENGVDRALNWAVYFCDFGKYQNPIPSGESTFASDANVVYKRSALEGIRPVWRDAFHETAVNSALLGSGQKLGLSPEVVVYQHRIGLDLRQAVKERFVWGRSYAATRVRGATLGTRLVYAALAPMLPGVLVARMISTAFRKGRATRAFVKASPLIALLTLAWSVGELCGYAAGQRGTSSRPVDNVGTDRVFGHAAAEF
jgi:hypothetical protein